MKKGTKIALGVTIPIIGIPIVALMILIIIYGSMFLWSSVKGIGKTKLDVIEESWEIEFPEDTKITYSYSTRGGFNGDGCTYIVCNFNNKPKEFLQDFSQDDYDKFISEYNVAVNLITEEGMEREKILLPSSGDNFIWKSIKKINNSIYFVYSENNNTLYILENIM